MKRLQVLAATLAVAAAVSAACENRGALVADPTRPPPGPSPSGSGWITPSPTATPTPFKLVTVTGSDPGPDGCTGTGGNADGWQPFSGDPDDPPTAGDALLCVWYCAIDTDASAKFGGPYSTPQELIEVWDFDRGVPEEYGIDPSLPVLAGGYPQHYPCVP